MRQSIQRLTRHSAVYGVGHIVSRSIGFLLLPIHTNCLSTFEYGIVSLLFSALAIFNVAFTYGMDTAFLRFFILGKTPEEKRRVFSTAHWMIFSTGLLWSAVLLAAPALFSEWVFRDARYTVLIRLAAGICFADALRLLPFLALRAEERSVHFVALNSLNIAVTLGLNVWFVAGLRLGIEGVFWANLAASAFAVLSTLPILLRWVRFTFGRSTLFELLKFGVPYVPAGLAVVVMEQISRFFIDRRISTEATGVFSAGYKLGMFMALVVAAFRFAWHPFFLSTSKQEDAPAVFARVLTYFTAVTGFLFLAMSVFVREIAGVHVGGAWLFGKAYLPGLPIVPVVMMAYILYGAYANFVVGIYLKKKSAWLPLATGTGAAVSVAANVLFVPRFGIMGAAWAVCLGYAAMAVFLYFVNRSLYPIPYEWGRVLKLAASFGLPFALFSALGSEWSLTARVLVCLLPFPLLACLRFLLPAERAVLCRIPGRLTGRFSGAGRA